MEVKLFSADLDGTLLGQDDEARAFRRSWQRLDADQKPLLCYNTGRMLENVLQPIRDRLLPEPDYIICGVGTHIYDYPNQRTLKEFSEILEEGWNLNSVEQVMAEFGNGIEKQPDHLQNEYKSSWFLDNAPPEDIEEIKRKLRAADLRVHVVYSSSRYLDVLPRWANKGNALTWLLDHLDLSPEQVVVAGDSGNDSAMFQVRNVRGIAVANRQPELYDATKHLPVYHSERERAWGVMEGLIHFGVLSEELVEQSQNGGEDLFEHELEQLVDTDLLCGVTEEQYAFIKEGYREAIKTIRRNITKMGFSACSLDDNEVRGTDENYRSVWARDGSITVIGTMSLDDPEIRKCQRKTLQTLMEHITPTGQIPANVSIDTHRPDYSGVGGICSIDSGLWVIIALYSYIKQTKDIDFLREHFPKIQLAMNWLSAHDGNNDALLEIPEAGDWTDLFGRSYHVLYDEVLWYRTNICMARLLQYLGDDDRAGDYLRWSQIIKKEINLNFWPSTQKHLYQSRTSQINFSDQQYSLGDSYYLIAQVTPFDYSWRCDVYGNVLAYLFNVMDKERAQQAFRFMWGVGVNDPFPVTNLYPVVTAGDSDWKRYYTVNLLNLPHHYHNGGIWPFIGAQWARFIDKLGQRELAMQELHRVAELNFLGIHHKWEFNEWVHGKTGKPMGKAFQAWSAAEYIAACHQLGCTDL